MRVKPSHIGVLKFGLEAGMPHPEATSLGAAPTLYYAGYGNIPNIQVNNNPQEVNAVGTYQGVDIVDGDVDVSFNVSLKLGRLDFIKYLIRGTGIEPNYFGLPVLALYGGTDASYGNEPFSWLVRYAVCNSFTLRSQEGSGSPVTLDANFIAIAVDPDAATPTHNLATMKDVAGRVLTWAHSNIIIGATSYRNYMGGLTIQVNNNCRPDVRRQDIAANNPLNRAAVAIVPGNETIQTTWMLKDQLPSNLRGDFGGITFQATNAATVPAGSKSLSVALASNRVSTHSLQQAEPGNPLSWQATTVSQFMSIVTA